MTKAFLGKGLSFPVRLLGEKLEQAEFEESVRQSILIILGTAKGERVMRPDFGCGIYALAFELKTASLAGTISQIVQEDLLRFEPRIDVLQVQVISQSDGDGEKLLINLDYRVRSTNNIFNLVYPFYLERSPD